MSDKETRRNQKQDASTEPDAAQLQGDAGQDAVREFNRLLHDRPHRVTVARTDTVQDINARIRGAAGKDEPDQGGARP